jgi:hypothetical protein
MENTEPQLPKTNAEWVIYYNSILNELTDNQKKIGEPISTDEFSTLPIKRNKSILKNYI